MATGAGGALALVLLGLAAGANLSAAKKNKNGEEMTQTLALPREPPAVATGETRRLIFRNVPLNNKGLLSQQTREALKAAIKLADGAPVIHIRAFVSGSGDLRRVPQLVSEIFADRRVRLPAVSVVQVGALPLENSQIAIQIISVGKKEVNPDGVDFLAGDSVVENLPGASAKPLLDRAVESLVAKLASRATLSVTCFVSSLQNSGEMTAEMAAKFPGAASSLVQTQRAPYQSYATCQAVVRGGIKVGVLAFSGTRVVSSAVEDQSALALQRLDRDLAEAGVPAGGLRFTNIYSLLPQAGEVARKLRSGAMSIIPVESVASVQAAFAIDAIGAVGK